MAACRVGEISVGRCSRYAQTLLKVRLMLGRDFVDAGRKDIEGVIVGLYDRGYKPWTVHFYKVTLKKFYRWLRGVKEDTLFIMFIGCFPSRTKAIFLPADSIIRTIDSTVPPAI